MNKIIIHTPHSNLELVRNALREMGMTEIKFETEYDHTYRGFHLGDHAECIVVETSCVLHVEAVLRMQAFGPIELSTTGSIGVDLSLN